ncbi:hypothetical protein [Planotetraspora phitsanulokensis]|nr:hypothetical protein [Planotetraspora phitsanulokensis]
MNQEISWWTQLASAVILAVLGAALTLAIQRFGARKESMHKDLEAWRELQVESLIKAQEAVNALWHMACSVDVKSQAREDAAKVLAGYGDVLMFSARLDDQGLIGATRKWAEDVLAHYNYAVSKSSPSMKVMFPNLRLTEDYGTLVTRMGFALRDVRQLRNLPQRSSE